MGVSRREFLDVVITSGGEKPHVTVTVDYSMLTGSSERLPEIDGASVTPGAIRQLTCDAGIVRMVVDEVSVPLDVGRQVRGYLGYQTGSRLQGWRLHVAGV